MYTGYTELTLSEEEYNELYSANKLQGYIFQENEYAMVMSEAGVVVDYF